MISLLLKNRRPPAHLLVAFLLVLGVILQRSEGLQCGLCNEKLINQTEKVYCSGSETCKDESSVCLNVDNDWSYRSISPPQQDRGCVDKELFSECLVKPGYASPGSECGLMPGSVGKVWAVLTCLKVNVSRGNDFGKGNHRSADAEKFKGRQGGTDEEERLFAMCLCDTDLCRCDTDSCPDSPLKPKPKPGEPSGSSHQHQTSSSILIFAILTLALYNNL